jgi:hypothetical protein
MRAQSTTTRVKERRPHRLDKPYLAAYRRAVSRARALRMKRSIVVSTLKAVVEALMYSLRSRGTKALEEPPTKRRLSQLSDAQVIEVGDRLQKLNPKIARAWTAEEVKALLQARG